MGWQLAVCGGGSRVPGVPREARVNPLVAGSLGPSRRFWGEAKAAWVADRIDQLGEAAVGQLVWKSSYLLSITMVLLVAPVEYQPYSSVSTDF